MEKVLEQALPQVTETIEPELAPLPPETTGGFPWSNAGIVVVLIAVVVMLPFGMQRVAKKLLCKK